MAPDSVVDFQYSQLKSVEDNMSKIAIKNFNTQSSEHHAVWKRLGLQWLQGYQHSSGTIPELLEDGDFITLDFPVENIIRPGGQIWFAELNVGENTCIVGTVGLMPHHGEWEIIKLAVQPEYQGQGIGKALVKTVISHAREKGIERLVLDSNSHLISAINLYESFGFQKIPTRGHFATADVAMELCLN